MQLRIQSTLLTCLLSGVLGVNVGRAETALVAVASNFMQPAKVLAQAFEVSSGHKIELAFGSSGKLSTQVINGAPFDVFLSADQAKAEALVERALGAQRAQETYALGALTLWSATPELILNAEWLSGSDVRRLAYANPRLAPYGAAAQQFLEAIGVTLAPHQMVLGENISQVYQFVATGAVEAGLVARSQLVEQWPASGSQWPVPPSYHEPIKQDMLLLKRGETNDAAQGFFDYLLSGPGREVILRYGYNLPTQNDTARERPAID